MNATKEQTNIDLPIPEQTADKTSSNSPTGEKEPSVTQDEEPYSIYTRKEKWFIVALTAYAGLFSPLTANVYFPAIPTLVTEFHKSTELINLTITIYMVFQALSPMFFGSLADQYGRRPMFIACLTILALTSIGLALVPTSDYWLLLVLRGVQAAGSASTIALGAGVIGDIAVSAERGGFYGIYGLGPMFGPAIGPVIGIGEDFSGLPASKEHPPNDGSLTFVEMFDFCAEHSPSHPAFPYQSPLDNTIHDIPWKVASCASLKAGPLALVATERAPPVIGILGGSIDKGHFGGCGCFNDRTSLAKAMFTV
ncbi:major facilitator superfamily domain-containing protein [Mycena floridula]|nr:major facilitator superfamily domain-containing protein [Mycena floridula]